MPADAPESLARAGLLPGAGPDAAPEAGATRAAELELDTGATRSVRDPDLRMALDGLVSLHHRLHQPLVGRKGGGVGGELLLRIDPVLRSMTRLGPFGFARFDVSECRLAPVEGARPGEHLDRALRQLLEEGVVGWAVDRGHPVVVAARGLPHGVLLQGVATPRRLFGILAAPLETEPPGEVERRVLTLVGSQFALALERHDMEAVLREHQVALEEDLHAGQEDIPRGMDDVRRGTDHGIVNPPGFGAGQVRRGRDKATGDLMHHPQEPAPRGEALAMPRAGSSPSPRGPRSPSPLRTSNRTRLLLVEDSPVVAGVTLAMLRRLGIEAMTAATAREAQRRYQDEGADLVLLDLDLGESSGLELVPQFHAADARAGRTPAPILGFSASVEVGRGHVSADVAPGMRLDGWVPKPASLQELAEALAPFLPTGVLPTPGRPASPAAASRIHGEDELARHLVQEARAQLSGDIHRLLPLLRAALAQADTARLKALAHRIRGAAAVAQLDALSAAAAGVEAASQAGFHRGLRGDVHRLLEALRALVPEPPRKVSP